MKRFLSFGFAAVMLSFIGCSYIGPRSSDDTVWWDGLTNREIMEATPIMVTDTGASSRADSIRKNFTIEWSLPVSMEMDKAEYFHVSYGFNDAMYDVFPDSITLTDNNFRITESGECYRYVLNDELDVPACETIIYFRVEMRDNNGEMYRSTASFVVYPHNKILRIRTAPDETEAAAINSIYNINSQICAIGAILPDDATLLFTDEQLKNQRLSKVMDIEKDNPFQLAILSEMSGVFDQGGTYARYSNSSFCRVNGVFPVEGAYATLKYSFEDLPLEMLNVEPPDDDGVRRFDYDDVVVYVDIMPGEVPGAVSGVGVELTGENSLDLSWQPAEGARSYSIYWSTSPDLNTSNGTPITGLLNTSYTFTGLEPGTTYYFLVTAKNSYGESIPSVIVNGMPAVVVDTPVGLSGIMQPGGTSIVLSWSRVQGAGSYNIYWSTQQGVTTTDGTPIEGITGNTYTITGLALNVPFYFIVTSVAGDKESEPSEEASVIVIKQVAAGELYTMILMTDGTLWATGYDDYGQLGDGTTVNKSTPVRVMTGVAAVACGKYHTMILMTDGTLWATGYNGHGQLGDGTTANRSTPVRVMAGVAAVSCGEFHTMILKTDRSLWATGSNRYGQLGDGTTDTKVRPANITSDISAVSCGGYHTMILNSSGILMGTGYNGYGQLGDGTTVNKTTPERVMTDVSAVSCGLHHTVILGTGGILMATGLNGHGQLGDGTTADKSTPERVMTDVSAVSCGLYHTMILRTGGNLMATGLNAHGQLGDGTTVNKSIPEAIMGDDVSAAFCGGYHTMILKTDGSLWATGSNSYGQLGMSTIAATSTPVVVKMP